MQALRPCSEVLDEPLNSATDACNAMAAIAQAMARGDLMPVEAAELSRLVEAYVKAGEAIAKQYLKEV